MAGHARAALEGSLILLRARAIAHPGQTAQVSMGAYSFAWRRDGGGVERLAVRGRASRKALINVLAALPAALVPRQRVEEGGGEAVVFVLRHQPGCDRCGWPVDPEGKYAAGGRCTSCSGGKTRCRHCGIAIDDAGGAWELCAACSESSGGMRYTVCSGGCGNLAAVEKASFGGQCSGCAEKTRRSMGWAPYGSKSGERGQQ